MYVPKTSKPKPALPETKKEFRGLVNESCKYCLNFLLKNPLNLKMQAVF